MFNSYVKLPEGSIAMSLLRFEMNSCTFRITGYQHIYSHLSIYIIGLFLFLFICIYIHTRTHTHTHIYILYTYPIGSMYAIYGNIYHKYTPNVSIYIYIYTIHGSYGYMIVFIPATESIYHFLAPLEAMLLLLRGPPHSFYGPWMPR